MITKRLTLLILIIAACNAASAASTAIINVNVVPMLAETVIPAQTVVVEDGLISAIGSVDKVPVPEDAEVVDGTDRYLMPGLVEMHAHVPDTTSQNLGRVLTLFAVNGVTAIRGMLGQPSHLDLRQQLLSGEVFGPRLFTSGPSMNGDSVSNVADGVARVRAQHAAGYDFIKIHPGLSADEFLAIAAEANKLGIPFAGHVPVAVGVENALRAGMATIDHLDGYVAALMPINSDRSGGYGGFFDILLVAHVSEERIPELAEKTAAAGVWNVPTESLFEHRVSDVSVVELSNRPEMRYMPAAAVERWASIKQQQLDERGFDARIGARAIAIRRSIIFSLHKAGARLLLGSDAPQVFNVPGFSLHRELAFLVEAGLTPYEALQAGTTAAAEFLGTNAGSVAVGRDADLVLLDANPLAEISNTRRVHGVMLRGSWHSSAQLEQRLMPYRQKSD
ncbi:MAG: amidohydrolase family protein [Desulfobulbaceae bacterium]|nr:amidohydrolase family protein [Desulfobulbaceae bacterium]